MVHHRCTRCKQESSPRHKYHGGVFFDSCIQIIRGYRPDSTRGFFGRVWDKVTNFVDRVIHHRHTVKLDVHENSKIHTRLKVMEARARSIPHNPEGNVPQKR